MYIYIYTYTCSHHPIREVGATIHISQILEECWSLKYSRQLLIGQMHLCHCHVDWCLLTRWEKSVWFYDPTERHREASYLTSNDALVFWWGIFWVFWSLVFILTEHTVCSGIRLSVLTPKEQLHSVSLWITLALNWNLISCIHTFFLTNARHIQWLCLRWLHGTLLQLFDLKIKSNCEICCSFSSLQEQRRVNETADPAQTLTDMLHL